MTGEETGDRRSHLATDKPSLRGSVANMDAVGDGADGLHVFLPQWLTARPYDPQPPGAAPALLTQVGHLHQLGGHQEGHGALLTAQHLPLKGDRVVRDTLAHVQQHPVGHSHSVSTLWVTVSTLWVTLSQHPGGHSQHPVGHTQHPVGHTQSAPCGSQSAPCGSHSVSNLWVTAPCGSHSVSTLWVTLSQHPVGHTQSAHWGVQSLNQHSVGHSVLVSTLWVTLTYSAPCGSHSPSQHPVGHTRSARQHPVGHSQSI